jgi:acyl carrier protein
MHPEEIRSRLTAIFVDILGADPGKISDNTLFEEIAADSLEVTQAVMEVEAVFGIEISDKDADRLVTVGDVVTLVEASKKGHPAV